MSEQELSNVYDELNRIYILKYKHKTVVYKYWGKTNLIKIVYHIVGDVKNPKQIEIDVLGKDGSFILSYSNTLGMQIKIPNFKGFNKYKRNDIQFTILKNKVADWKKKIKKR
jgi:uncharacterized protein YabN with tetrapyrrole methylase and pyrophosphatase domain